MNGAFSETPVLSPRFPGKIRGSQKRFTQKPPSENRLWRHHSFGPARRTSNRDNYTISSKGDFLTRAAYIETLPPDQKFLRSLWGGLQGRFMGESSSQPSLVSEPRCLVYYWT